MPGCEEIILKLFEENPNLTDKEITAKMKDLKDKKGKRLYRASTIRIRLRQVREKQRVPSEPPEIKKIDLDDAKKEVEEAFGSKNKMGEKAKEAYAFDFFDGAKFIEQKIMSEDEAGDYALKTNTIAQLNIVHKTVEPQEMESGHKKYDGRIDHESSRDEIDTVISKYKHKADKEPPGIASDSRSEDGINEKLNEIIIRMDTMNNEIHQLKQGGLPVEDKLVDVQLRESIIGILDDLKVDDSEDLNEIIRGLVERKSEVKDVAPGFLEKIRLDKNDTAHGKLFIYKGKWKFFKRAKPVIYGVAGGTIGCCSLFVLFVLLRALGLLPGWI